MSLRKGDRVSISINPVVALSRFVNCKAHATLTRELGDDPEADLEQMGRDIVGVYREALLAELGQLSELQEVVGVPRRDAPRDDDVDRLVQYCLNSVGKRRVGEEETEDRKPKKSGARKKSRARKKRRV